MKRFKKINVNKSDTVGYIEKIHYIPSLLKSPIPHGHRNATQPNTTHVKLIISLLLVTDHA
jgi:hypothetical protein